MTSEPTTLEPWTTNPFGPYLETNVGLCLLGFSFGLVIKFTEVFKFSSSLLMLCRKWAVVWKLCEQKNIKFEYSVLLLFKHKQYKTLIEILMHFVPTPTAPPPPPPPRPPCISKCQKSEYSCIIVQLYYRLTIFLSLEIH